MDWINKKCNGSVTECKRIICLQLCHFVRRGLSVHIIVSFSEAGREWLRWTRCMAGIIGEWSTCRSDWRLASLHFAVQKTTVLIKVQQQSQQQELPGTPISRNQKGKTSWMLLKQETVGGNGTRWAICNSAPRCRQIPCQHSSPTSQFLQAGCPSCHPTNSSKALKLKSWNSDVTIVYDFRPSLHFVKKSFNVLFRLFKIVLRLAACLACSVCIFSSSCNLLSSCACLASSLTLKSLMKSENHWGHVLYMFSHFLALFSSYVITWNVLPISLLCDSWCCIGNGFFTNFNRNRICLRLIAVHIVEEIHIRPFLFSQPPCAHFPTVVDNFPISTLQVAKLSLPLPT